MSLSSVIFAPRNWEMTQLNLLRCHAVARCSQTRYYYPFLHRDIQSSKPALTHRGKTCIAERWPVVKLGAKTAASGVKHLLGHWRYDMIRFTGYGVIAEKPRVGQLGRIFPCTLLEKLWRWIEKWVTPFSRLGLNEIVKKPKTVRRPVCEYGLISASTDSKSLRRRVFPINHLRWHWQPRAKTRVYFKRGVQPKCGVQNEKCGVQDWKM